MIYPSRLQKGDTIGVIAPAGTPNPEKVQKAIPFFKKMGLHVKLGKHIDKIYGYLAGSDKERLADIHDMIANPEIKAIIFARGGYGTARLAANIDYHLIRSNPKIIWGYSDITYLHTAIRQATGLVTFHGPMLASDIAKENFDYLSASMFNQLFEPTALHYSEAISSLDVLASGYAEGELVGGNLSLLASSIGTPYEIDTLGKLLLLEDIGEEPYRVDGMLNQLKLAGKLADAAGIVIGDFSEAEPTVDVSLTLEQVFVHYFQDLGCPVMKGFKIGHCLPHFTVPLGVKAQLSTIGKSLVIEPGVR
ncbi:muramoyltetrapeptide carboxypeptidase [Virgibacillus natechei]|uniref:Muramoyltetrapeptide carboxypeptidase n=1 Tax=Virgibacillus natechei TaxID=1216297 RepID=A0ABS4IM96_9BACI|nr:LD-carboxypeptidase [Virgibacillus natechei]MBP1971690.1 muramoyltetrapeptide carboxypeptidase [Virgibacillus natechei]UZD12579.1 LD-carboxypeptidase [Virgibacillus natechei]